MKSPLNRGGLRFYLVIIALAAGTLLAGSTSPYTILTGLPCLILGALLHTWAKGCLRQNRVVATIGPYRFVRHPFYLANALIDAGLVLMAGWWPLAVALPVWWLAIYLPVIRGEESYLSEKFPDQYPAYRRQVPCMIPWRRPLPYAGDGFRWDNPNIAGGEELPRLARILAYPLLFFVIQGLRGSGLPWLKDGWHLTGLSGLLMLYVLRWELQGHQRQQRWILPSVMRHPALRLVASAILLTVVSFVSAPRTSLGAHRSTPDALRWSELTEPAGPSGMRENSVPIGGAILMLLSVPVFARRPVRAVVAEAIALLGATAAGELLWLAPAVVVVYSAWILDYQLASVNSASGPSGAASAQRFWPYLYPIVAVACAAVIGVKLAGHVWPYHMAIF
jgi:hypothetical protein